MSDIGMRILEALPVFRWVLPDCTTTEAAILQQAHRDCNSGDLEWRPVPTVIAGADQIFALRHQSSQAEKGEGDVSEWRDISTAPKDRVVLLTCVGWEASIAKGELWSVKVGGWWNQQWNVFGASWKPTHWLPLPTPPHTGKE